jgi:hypothetical protein
MSDDLNMHYRRNLPKEKSLVFSTNLECIFSCIVVVKSIGGENQCTRPDRHKNFEYIFLYLYSKLVQSEQSIYLIQYSDWLFFEYVYQLIFKSFMTGSPVINPELQIIFKSKG